MVVCDRCLEKIIFVQFLREAEIIDIGASFGKWHG